MTRWHLFIKKEDYYNKLARICLSADGGYCESCAIDVAEGFKKEYPQIDLKILQDKIDEQIVEYKKSLEAK